MTIGPTREMIDEALDRCARAIDEGRTAYPGETYESGVQAAINWLLGQDGPPFETAHD